MPAVDKMFGIGVILSLQNQLSPVAKAAGKDLTELQTQVGGLDQQLKQFEGFQAMAQRGAGMTKWLTAPLMAAGAVATKASMDWESAFTGVRKTVDETEEGFKELEAGLLDMALNAIPMLPTELAGITEAAGQLGIEGKDNLLTFTETIAKLGVTTNLTAEQGATDLARFANITGMPIANVDRLGSSIVALGNSLATSEAEIVSMSMRLAGSGRIVGMAEHQILAISGAMSSVGISAEAGGTAMSKLMIELANAVASGSPQLELFAAVAGQTAGEFAESFRTDAAGAITQFMAGIGEAHEAGANVFALLDDMGIQEVRMRDAVLRLAGASDLMADSLRVGEEAWQENTALALEAALRFGTTEEQLKLTRNAVWRLSKEFGDALLPVLRLVNRGIYSAMKLFIAMPKPIKTGIVVIGALVAAIGPLLWTFGTMASSLMSLQTYLATTGSVVGALKAPFGMLQGMIGSLLGGLKAAGVFLVTNPIGIALLGLAGAATLFYFAWKNNWLGVRDLTDQVVGWFKAIWADEGILGFLKLLAPLGWFQEAWKGNWFGIRDRTGQVVDWLGGIWEAEGLLGFLKLLSPLGWFHEAWKGNWFGIRDAVGGVVNWVQERLGSFVDWLGNLTVVGWLGEASGAVGALWARLAGKRPAAQIPEVQSVGGLGLRERDRLARSLAGAQEGLGRVRIAWEGDLWSIRSTTERTVARLAEAWQDRGLLGFLDLLNPLAWMHETWEGNWLGIRDLTSGVAGWLGELWESEGLLGFLRLLHPLGFFAEAWEGNWVGIRDVMTTVIEWMGERITAFVDWLANLPLVSWVAGLGEKAGGLLERFARREPAPTAPPTTQPTETWLQRLLPGALPPAMQPAFAGAGAMPTAGFAMPQAAMPALPTPMPMGATMQAGDEISVNVDLRGRDLSPATADTLGRDIARAIKREKEGRPR